jgi:hypothetical protein
MGCLRSKTIETRALTRMSKSTEQGVLFEGLTSKNVAVLFDAPAQSSDGGLPLLIAVNRRLGLIERIAAELVDRRDRARIEHSFASILGQRILSIALGYADGNDAARMGADPLLKLACGRPPSSEGSLASQPTLSRFERAQSGRSLVAMGRVLEDVVIDELARSHPRARRITIDLDGSVDPTHGQQPFAFFNGYYDSWCYLPLFGFLSVDDEPEQRLFFARLRPGTVKETRGSLALLRRVVPELRKRFKRARILVRLDAGFAYPQLFDLLEELRVDYVVAMGQNDVLAAMAERHMHAARTFVERFGETTAFYGEGSYKTQSWPRERCVIFKAEVVSLPGREPRDNLRIVVTNLRQAPEQLWKLYCQRGDSENRIKELKVDLQIDRTSSTSFLANQFRVLQTAAAFVLFQALRYRLRHTELARAQVSTLRQRLLKIGATVRESLRRIVISLPECFPWKRLWREAAMQLGAYPR